MVIHLCVTNSSFGAAAGLIMAPKMPWVQAGTPWLGCLQGPLPGDLGRLCEGCHAKHLHMQTPHTPMLTLHTNNTAPPPPYSPSLSTRPLQKSALCSAILLLGAYARASW